MKFALIAILGFCAIAAQADYSSNYETPNALKRGAIMDRLKEFIENIVKEVNEAVDGIIEKAKEIAENIQEQIHGLVEQAEAYLDEIIKIFEDKLQEIINQGEQAGECVQKYQPEFAAVITTAKADIESCTTHAQNQATTLVNGIFDKVNSIKAHMTELSEIITNCFEDFTIKPISAISCVTEKANEIKSAITTIIAEAKQGLEGATQQGADIVSDATHCTTTTVTTAQNSFNDVFGKIEKCLASIVQ